MGIGKEIRLGRLLSHPSGKFCAVAVDHFVGYQRGLPDGLKNVPEVVAKLVAGEPDAIAMNKGIAKSVWSPHAGKIPLIVSSVIFTPDDTVIERIASPEEVLRMGAEAIAVAIGVRGANEGRYLKILADVVEVAACWDLPVIAHVYPRVFSDPPRIVFDPENVAWAARCGLECGADILKVPFTGEAASFREIVAACPVPVVAAGGPKTDTLEHALVMMSEVMRSGARGATIGRNIWGTPDPTQALLAFKAVIHDGLDPAEALRTRGLPDT